MVIEEAAFPSFNFNSIGTWNGAFLGYGGLAWFYLFNQKLCTYGVHSNCSVFWNSTTGDALKIAVAANGKKVAMKFSRSANDHLLYNIAVSDSELTCRYEAEKNELQYFKGNDDHYSFMARTASKISLEIEKWNIDEYSWLQSSTTEKGMVSYILHVSKTNSLYIIKDGNKSINIKSDKYGLLKFGVRIYKRSTQIKINSIV